MIIILIDIDRVIPYVYINNKVTGSMGAINKIVFILLIIFTVTVQPQQQKVLVFDPNGVSGSFQYFFTQLSNDSVFVADTIDEYIHNFDALFLFIEYPYVLSQYEGNDLIDYLILNKPIYFTTNLYWQEIDSTTFWNYIGIEWYAETLSEVHVDSVLGVDTAFTKGEVIDTSFISPGAPHIGGSVRPILDGIEQFGHVGLHSTFIPMDESLNVIIDLYNLIHHPEFLQKVIEQFGLKDPLIINNEIFSRTKEYRLTQNYPNPFNPTTKIKFTIPERSFVTLKIYDVLGNEIATLVNEEKLVGSYEIEFNATNLPSGIYFYRLQAGNFVVAKKMVVLK
jgi:hypothetical protein